MNRAYLGTRWTETACSILLSLSCLYVVYDHSNAVENTNYTVGPVHKEGDGMSSM